MSGKQFRLILYPLVCLAISLAVYAGVFGSLRQTLMHLPSNTVNLYAQGYIPDYYQYLSWVRQGMDGKLLAYSRLTEAHNPPVLIHPLFTLTGFMGGILGMTPWDALLMSRYLSTGIFLLAVFVMIARLTAKPAARAVDALILATATGWYTLAGPAPVHTVEPVSWSGNFNSLWKFSLPSHHLLGLAGMIAVVMLLSDRIDRKRTAIAAALAIAVGFLNPSLLIALDLSLVAASAIYLVLKRKATFPFVVQAATTVIVSSPVLFYNMYLFGNVQPWKQMYDLMKRFFPPVTWRSFVLALGPLVPFSLLGLADRKSVRNPKLLVLAAWGYLPFALFPLAGTYLPMNHGRLFQWYQFVPLGVLAGMGAMKLIVFAGKKSTVLKYAAITVVAATVAYGIVPAYVTYRATLNDPGISAFNISLPLPLYRALLFLDTDKTERVVLSGEFTSLVVPAVTRHRAMLGRDDNALDYYPKRDEAFRFLNGKMNREEARTFLDKRHIGYLLTGMDAYRFEDLPYAKYPFLKTVFSDGTVSVVKVIR